MTFKHLGLAAVAMTAAATLASQAGAQGQAAAPLLLTGPTPAGFCSFNGQRALLDSTAGKYMVSRLGELGGQVRAELQSIQTGIQTDAQTYESQKATLAPAQVQSRGEALEGRAQQFQRLQQIRQRELQDTQNQAEQTIITQLLPIVQQTAVSRHCTLVISAEALAVGNPAIDITDAAIAGLNTKLTQFPIEREHLDTGAAGAH